MITLVTWIKAVWKVGREVGDADDDMCGRDSSLGTRDAGCWLITWSHGSTRICTLSLFLSLVEYDEVEAVTSEVRGRRGGRRHLVDRGRRPLLTGYSSYKLRVGPTVVKTAAESGKRENLFLESKRDCSLSHKLVQGVVWSCCELLYQQLDQQLLAIDKEFYLKCI